MRVAVFICALFVSAAAVAQPNFGRNPATASCSITVRVPSLTGIDVTPTRDGAAVSVVATGENVLFRTVAGLPTQLVSDRRAPSTFHVEGGNWKTIVESSGKVTYELWSF